MVFVCVLQYYHKDKINPPLSHTPPRSINCEVISVANATLYTYPTPQIT